MIFREAAGGGAVGALPSPCITVETDPSVTATATPPAFQPGPTLAGTRGAAAPAWGREAVVASGAPGSAPQPLAARSDSATRPGTTVHPNTLAGPRERGEMIGNMR